MIDCKFEININLREKEFDVLTIDEEIELFKKYKKTNSKLIRNEIVKRNLRFVSYVVHNNFKKIIISKNLDINYLFNIGVIGLIESIDKFDLSKNVRFSTFSFFYIKRAIYNEIYSTVLSNNMGDTFKLSRLFQKTKNLRNKGLTDDEIFNTLNISKNLFKEVKKYGKNEEILSLNILINSEMKEDKTFEDNLISEIGNPVEEIEKKDLKYIFEKIFNDNYIFPNNEKAQQAKTYIKKYYYENKKLIEIGKENNMTKQGVLSMIKRYMKKIKIKYEKQLKDYLY